MTAKKAGGRPASYSPELITEAIASLEARGESATAEAVKDVLFTEHGVKRSVRPESLDAEIRVQLVEHERQRDDACIARLPEVVRGEIDAASASVARLMAIICGRHQDKTEKELASRLDEEARQRLELVRRLAEVEAERDHALGQVLLNAETLETTRTTVEARERQIAKLEKRIARLEGVIEGRRSIDPATGGLTGPRGGAPV